MVPSHISSSAAGPAREATRSAIWAAARRVNVSARSEDGGQPSATSRAARLASVIVLPVPAPARTSVRGLAEATAAAWASLSITRASKKKKNKKKKKWKED